MAITKIHLTNSQKLIVLMTNLEPAYGSMMDWYGFNLNGNVENLQKSFKVQHIQLLAPIRTYNEQ